MNEEQSLIEAIQADPDSDAARLIYADWLEEQGDARGGFLRAELSFAAAETLYDATDGIAYFNTTHYLDLDQPWLDSVAMKFDLSISGSREDKSFALHILPHQYPVLQEKLQSSWSRRSLTYPEPMVLTMGQDLISVFQHYSNLMNAFRDRYVRRRDITISIVRSK